MGDTTSRLIDKAIHESVSLVCILTRPSVERLWWLEYLVFNLWMNYNVGSLLLRQHGYRIPIIWRIDSTGKIPKVNGEVLSPSTAQVRAYPGSLPWDLTREFPCER